MVCAGLTGEVMDSLLLFWIVVWYCRVIMMDDVEAVDWWKGKTLQRWIYPDRDERCRKDDDNNDDDEDIHISICVSICVYLDF
jgi:hypothetical protein